MHALRAADSNRVLELIAGTLERAGPGFPDATLTASLRDLFQAEFAGAASVDFRGTDSRRWADSPQLAQHDDDFHSYAVNHPMARAHARSGDTTPLRLSDLPGARPPPADPRGTSRVLTIPLTITPHGLCGIALMRGGPDFTTLDMRLACGLQPVFGAIYALRECLNDRSRSPHDPDTGIHVTLRELAVLDLMAEGLIAAAIAHRLGISPRTVGRHMESIYRKLETHDRTSAVLRGQSLGLLTRKDVPRRRSDPHLR